MKYSAATTVILVPVVAGISARELQESYTGPGRIECYDGSCEFTIDTGLGCSDPCHTYTISNPFEYSFAQVAEVSGKIRHYPSHELCYYRKASKIDTENWMDHWGLKIDTGCFASCRGCTFSPTETYTGPGSIQCVQGDCYNYTYGGVYNDCGTEVQDASEEWGAISVLGHGTNDARVFSGYNNITTTGPIVLGEECTLDCSGCQFTRLGKVNMLKQKPKHKAGRYSNDQ